MKLNISTPRWAVPLLADARYKAVHGGRGSGKSHFFGEYVVERHIANPNESTVCVREIQKSLGQSVKRLIEQKIESMNAGWYFDIQDAKIKSKYGDGIIIFQGMQNHTADSIKSLEGFDRAWVEEAQTFSAYSLELLRPTLRKENSEILFSWNPRYKTDPVDMLFRKNPPPKSIVIQANWYDNPWFPQVLKDEMEFDFGNDPDRAEHIWNGSYGSSQGAILARFVNQAQREGRINNDVVYDEFAHPIEISADLGFRDTASFWYWQRVPGGFKLLQYDADTGLDADEWIPRIKENILKFGKLGKIWLPHDARAKTFQSRHTTMERFVDYFGPDKVAVVPQSKKQDQINAARLVIQRCSFNETLCDDGLEGLRAWEYVYDEVNNVFSREPNHNWASHPSDAFAYGCQVMQEFVEVPKVDDKPIRGIHVGQTDVTLNELWAKQPNKQSKRI
jgi:phage terminase large subunit